MRIYIIPVNEKGFRTQDANSRLLEPVELSLKSAEVMFPDACLVVLNQIGPLLSEKKTLSHLFQQWHTDQRFLRTSGSDLNQVIIAGINRF
jgi:hypothetical protein